MQIFHTIPEIRDFVRQARNGRRSVGLVPTMGCLHEGHLELMRRAGEQCAVVVVSIFVNPAQFGPHEDFANYPRDLERDVRMSGKAGVDAIFNPSVPEMYPEGFCTRVEVERITEKLCGRSRPGHFSGVATVVTKLFNIVKPDRAYFGQKDAQQALVIKRMAADLNLDLEVVTLPTVREPDGLAMSSRNRYLGSEERRAAVILYKSLQHAKELYRAGERDAAGLRRSVAAMIAAESLAAIDYVEIYSYPELEEVAEIRGPVLLALAVKIGRARLIDNIVLE
ncbi:MAG: Pantothenate synthetase [Pelotomaculum thermopropionicum]|uniref:Pantothenate synthetase n=1 Tax=Pelotomaculum thermopropionicum TaxID=110500 RepID=A0A101HTV7_9FIRM|nr:MAG: Pantothenate synthetase [Pelotomaculum thermopropionicum]